MELAEVAADLRVRTEKMLLRVCINDGILIEAPGLE